MKYNNGKTPKVGDHVVGTDKNGVPIVGYVGEILSSGKTKRLVINPVRLPAFADAADCILVADAVQGEDDQPQNATPGTEPAEAAAVDSAAVDPAAEESDSGEVERASGKRGKKK